MLAARFQGSVAHEICSPVVGRDIANLDRYACRFIDFLSEFA